MYRRGGDKVEKNREIRDSGFFAFKRHLQNLREAHRFFMGSLFRSGAFGRVSRVMHLQVLYARRVANYSGTPGGNGIWALSAKTPWERLDIKMTVKVSPSCAEPWSLNENNRTRCMFREECLHE